MGQFSWLYSDTGEAIINDRWKKSYVLVPDPFVNVYGKYICEERYDGYGHFGGYDIYELIAKWNQDVIDAATFSSHSMKVPKLDNFCGLFQSEKDCLKKNGLSDEEIAQKDLLVRQQHFDAASKRLQLQKESIMDFCNHVTEKDMKERYGNDYLREIGILFACYDEDNAALLYPIKITSMPMDYASAKPSLSDKNQGWN